MTRGRFHGRFHEVWISLYFIGNSSGRLESWQVKLDQKFNREVKLKACYSEYNQYEHIVCAKSAHQYVKLLVDSRD